MVFSTASIFPFLINTSPGVSVGPETVWTIAPVSRMASALSELTREKQSDNTAAARTNSGHEFGKRLGVANNVGQASRLSLRASRPRFRLRLRIWAVETPALRSCDVQVLAIIRRAKIRLLNDEM